jgi:hypothetical protein
MGSSSMTQTLVPPSSTGWRQLYESAILELDNGMLPERIAVARLAILERTEEILTEPSSSERHALSGALRALQALEEVAARNHPQP